MEQRDYIVQIRAQQIAALEKDKDRLDWLQQQKKFDANLQENGSHKVYAHKEAKEFAGATLRSAIDAAMAKEKEND